MADSGVAADVVWELDGSRRVVARLHGGVTTVEVSSWGPGQQQQRSTSRTTGPWVDPPTLDGETLVVRVASGELRFDLELTPMRPIEPLKPLPTMSPMTPMAPMAPMQPMTPMAPMQPLGAAVAPCGRCGQVVDADDRFCRRCGERLAQ